MDDYYIDIEKYMGYDYNLEYYNQNNKNDYSNIENYDKFYANYNY